MRPPQRDAGFDAAFFELFPRARRVAHRVLDDWLAAEDIAAEALARACLHWGRISELEWRDAWVVRVATNLAIDAARRRRPAVESRVPGDAVEASVTHLALVGAIRQLPRRQREVVALRYFSDLTEAEVASTLAISVSSVKTHGTRALAALRANLGDEAEAIGLAGN